MKIFENIFGGVILRVGICGCAGAATARRQPRQKENNPRAKVSSFFIFPFFFAWRRG